MRRPHGSGRFPLGVLLASLPFLPAGCAPGGDPGSRPDAATAPPAADAPVTIGPGLRIRSLAPGVWMHTTTRELEGVEVPSHGLVVEDGDGLLLVDSAWGEEETVRLVSWLERELGRPLTRVLATHHHEDRLSGSGWLQERGTPVLAHPLTPALAIADGLTPPGVLAELAEAGSSTRVGPVEVLYPGAGHAADNLVVWVPEAGVLYGGCAVRPGDTGSLGNTADADLESWPRAIERVIAWTEERGGERVVVIPGHGDPGGPEVLEHTLALLRGAGSR